jgi:ABC-type transport system involved in multi-copper enzyme maturation permease subunit
MRRLVAVAANTFRETVRERVLFNLVLFGVLMTLSGLLLGQLSIRQDENIIKQVGLAAMDLFGTLIAIFVGVGLVSKEIERRSLYPLLAKPVSRDEFFLGKFLGLSATILVNVGVMSLGLFATLLATGRGADPWLLAAAYGIFLSLLLTVALALLFSTVTSPALAAIGTLCMVLAGRFSDVIRGMSDVTTVPSWLVAVLYYALPNFRNFDIKSRVVWGDPVPLPVLVEMTAYAVAYAGVALLAGLARFRSRDLV